MVQNGDGARWRCHVVVMVWCGDNVGAGRMQGGRDADVGGQWCGDNGMGWGWCRLVKAKKT